MAATVDLTRKQDGGVRKTILRPGSMPFIPVEGDTLLVKYKCTVDAVDGAPSEQHSGRVVEDRQEDPVLIILGRTSVLPAVEACLRAMRPGERCELVVEPAHAYGDQETDKIPANSRLLFDIDLIEIRGVDVSEDCDGSVRKSPLRRGVGKRKLTRGTQVMIRYRIIPPGDADTVPDWTSCCFTLGRAARTEGFIRDVDLAVLSLRRGDLARFSFVRPWGGAEAPVVAEIELQEVEKYMAAWQMNADQRLAQAKILKSKAAGLVEEELPDVALPLYYKVIADLNTDVGFDDAQKRERHQLLLACHLNASLCHLRVNQASSCVDQSTAALQLCPFSEKALFRRAMALHRLKDSAAAAADLRRLLSRHPNNRQARQMLTEFQDAAKAERETEAALCRRVLDHIHEWGIRGEGNRYGGAGDYRIDTWRNELAAHMMSIPQELEAFGEEMPQPRQRHASQGSADGAP